MLQTLHPWSKPFKLQTFPTAEACSMYAPSSQVTPLPDKRWTIAARKRDGTGTLKLSAHAGTLPVFSRLCSELRSKEQSSTRFSRRAYHLDNSGSDRQPRRRLVAQLFRRRASRLTWLCPSIRVRSKARHSAQKGLEKEYSRLLRENPSSGLADLSHLCVVQHLYRRYAMNRNALATYLQVLSNSAFSVSRLCHLLLCSLPCSSSRSRRGSLSASKHLCSV